LACQGPCRDEAAGKVSRTAIRVPAGGKLRVEVASGSFTVFSRDLTTGEHNETESRFVRSEQPATSQSATPATRKAPLQTVEVWHGGGAAPPVDS
jgi:hypothetical protein